MNRLNSRFAALAGASRKALIPYISAGDPDPEQTVAIMHALVAGGADVIELGIPFSDPAADGEIIQRANERALARGVTLVDVLAMVRQFREQDTHTPVVLMGYLNSFERNGVAHTLALASRAGVDGVIMVDCPVEALPDYRQALDASGILPIMLVAPTTSDARLAHILQAAGGFVYYVSLRGVTGRDAADAGAIREAVEALKAKTRLPVCIGFGIRDGQTARAMTAFADGAVIGSALVQTLHEAALNGEAPAQCAEEFARGIRRALDSDEEQS